MNSYTIYQVNKTEAAKTNSGLTTTIFLYDFNPTKTMIDTLNQQDEVYRITLNQNRIVTEIVKIQGRRGRAIGPIGWAMTGVKQLALFANFDGKKFHKWEVGEDALAHLLEKLLDASIYAKAFE